MFEFILLFVVCKTLAGAEDNPPTGKDWSHAADMALVAGIVVGLLSLVLSAI